MQTYEEVLEFIEEENVKFIKLAFFDAFGEQRNVAIMPGQLRRAVLEGVSFDASSVAGFGGDVHSDLFLKPDLSTMSIVPWRPMDGGVCRVFCDVYRPDGLPCENDTRYILKQAVKKARDAGVRIDFGPEIEFYVFKKDPMGNTTKEPIDNAGYMAVAPDDQGENLRRDICFALVEMGITPEASHHEQGPGQNEIDFHYGDPVTTADNTATVKWAIRNLAEATGRTADFSPKPIQDKPGSGMHFNISVEPLPGVHDPAGSVSLTEMFMAGVMKHIREITLFLNPLRKSYERFGQMEAPYFISWGEQNRTQLIRIPAATSGRRRIELRSPDAATNPYLAFALVIYAGLDGIENAMRPDLPMNANMYRADPDLTRRLDKLPRHIDEAMSCAKESDFVRTYVPLEIMNEYCDPARAL